MEPKMLLSWDAISWRTLKPRVSNRRATWVPRSMGTTGAFVGKLGREMG
jgi:hypothetical protein